MAIINTLEVQVEVDRQLTEIGCYIQKLHLPEEDYSFIIKRFVSLIDYIGDLGKEKQQWVSVLDYKPFGTWTLWRDTRNGEMGYCWNMVEFVNSKGEIVPYSMVEWLR